MLTLSSAISTSQAAVDELGQASISLIRETGSSLGPLADEDNELLASQLVTLSVSWGDGSVEVLGTGASPLAVDPPVHTYRPGVYSVVLSAVNHRVPVPDKAVKTFELVVVNPIRPSLEIESLIGPIIPRDVGFPNSSQWNFNLGRGSQLIESSVKLILLTAKGERLMNPEFGTSLSRLIYEPDDAVVTETLQVELAKALADFEPRARLEQILVSKNSTGGWRVGVELTNLINGQPLTLFTSV